MSRYELSTAEYRRVVAHLMYWERGLSGAIADCNLPSSERQAILDQLAGCGYEYDEDTDTLKYTGN